MVDLSQGHLLGNCLRAVLSSHETLLQPRALFSLHNLVGPATIRVDQRAGVGTVIGPFVGALVRLGVLSLWDMLRVSLGLSWCGRCGSLVAGQVVAEEADYFTLLRLASPQYTLQQLESLYQNRLENGA